MGTKEPVSGKKRKAGAPAKVESSLKPKKQRLDAEMVLRKAGRNGDPGARASTDSKEHAAGRDYVPPKKAKAKTIALANGGQSSRESHQKQKQMLQERRAAKPFADELQRTKKLWERLRRQSHVPKEERDQLVEELFSIITGCIKDFVFKHDAVRAVQTAIKYATAERRKAIAAELKGTYADLAEGRYSKFLIAKLVSYNDAEVRDMIISEFYGKTKKLINHPEASWILDDIYRGAATKQQKAMLLREWYGLEFSLLGRNDESATAELAEILKNEPSKRGPIMKNLLAMINTLIQKQMTGFTMLHDAMLQYFLNLKPGTEEWTEFFELVKGDESGDLLKNMAFTPSGSKVVCFLLAHGTAKDRKQILKTYKDTIALMSGDPNGHLVVLSALEVMDDTKLSSKSVFSELLGDDDEKMAVDILATASNSHALFVILHVLGAPTSLFNALFPATYATNLQFLNEVYEIRKETSKKAPETRSTELVAALSPLLLKAISLAPSELVATVNGCHLVSQTMFSATGDKRAALEAIALVAGSESGEQSTDTAPQPHISSSAHGKRLLKTLVAGGVFDKETNQVKLVEPPLGFADILYPNIKDALLEWATGPGSLVVVGLLESAQFSSKAKLRSLLLENREALEAAASEETQPQRAARESAGKTSKGNKQNRKEKKAGAEAGTRVGNAGAKLLLEKLQ